MRYITPDEVTPNLRALFRTDEPQAKRCFTVLEGVSFGGKILCDDPIHPTWGAVVEPSDNTLYFGGNVDATIAANLFSNLRREDYVLVGMWLDDPRQSLLPPDPSYDGRTLEFYNRPIGEGLDPYLQPNPSEYQVYRLNRDLVMRTEWGPGDVEKAGGFEGWERSCSGYCVMRGDEMLSEASVGPVALNCYEPGVFTQPAHRGRGYATIAVAHLIQEIEASGGDTYWNCAKQNLASAAVARKLGYRIEKEYRCMAWDKLEG